MKHILVTNQTFAKTGDATAATTTDNINDLLKGSLAIFNATTGAIVASDGPITAEYISMYCGNTGEPDMVPLLPWKNFTVKYQAYTAPTVKIFAIGDVTKPLVFPSTMVADLTYGIETYDLEKFETDPERFRRYYVTTKTTDTPATILTSFVAQINADPFKIGTASVIDTTKGIKITTNRNATARLIDDMVDVGYVIERAGELTAAELNGKYHDATTTPTLEVAYGNAALDGGAGSVGYTNYSEGSGTSDQVLALEEEYSVHKGNTKSVYKPEKYYNAPTNVVAGQKYNYYQIIYRGDMPRPNPADGFNLELTIAMDTTITTLKTTLDLILGLVEPEAA